MRSLAEMQSLKLQAKVITHSAAISACEEGMQWQRAVRSLAEMQSLKLQANEMTHSAAVSACRTVR